MCSASFLKNPLSPGNEVLTNDPQSATDQYQIQTIPYTKNTIFSLLTTSPDGVISHYSSLLKAYAYIINDTANTGNISQFNIITTMTIKSKQSTVQFFVSTAAAIWIHVEDRIFGSSYICFLFL